MATPAPPAPVTYAKGGTEFTRGGSGSARIILRWPEVHRRTRRSRAQVYRDVRDGKFPAPVQLGPNAIGWYADEIDDWQASRPLVNYAPEHQAA